MDLPEEYVIQKFQTFCGGAKYLKHQHLYNGSCCICREGSSWLRKKRCYYLIHDNAICCHNCGWYSKPLFWIKQVSSLSVSEILSEAQKFEFIPRSVQQKNTPEIPIKPVVTEDLPHDPINLFDPNQTEYYKDNIVVSDVLSFIAKRHLLKAQYKPTSLFISLSDFIHSNRLIIPFYENNNIVFYQSRAIYDKDLQDRAKYISKLNGEKALFNYNKIDKDYDYIFLLEGPINAFFCKNGVAVAGIQENSQTHLTPLQTKQLLKYPLHKKIWVLDSQWIDAASRNKTKILIDQGESVFLWPETVGKKYKDFNDIVMDLKLNCINPEFILKNTYSGLNARIKLLSIKR